MSAFHASEAVKRAILSQLDRAVISPFSADVAIDALPDWSSSAGIPLETMYLIAALSQEFWNEIPGGGRRYAEATLDAIPVGAVLDGLAHDFIHWAWYDAPQPLRDFVTSPALRAITGDVMEMHKAGAACVKANAWQVARNALETAMIEPAGLLEHYAASVAWASAWPVSRMPGAVFDIYEAWQAFERQRIYALSNWSNALSDLATARTAELNDRIDAELGGAPPKSEQEAYLAYVNKRRAMADEYLRFSPDEIRTESKVVQIKVIDGLVSLRMSCRNGIKILIKCC